MSAILFLIMAQVLSPGLTSMEPASGVRETSLTVTLTGTNFAPGMTVNAGFGIAVSNIVVIDSTLATADFVIAANAPLGIHNVTVTTEGGSGSLNTFNVLPPPPAITAISPSTGNPGSTLRVTLTGTNFVLGFTLETGGDITVTGLSLLNATTAAATFATAPEAALGERTVTMTTRGGVSEPFLFTIVAPSSPTLTEVSPATGVQDARVNVTLTGTNFVSGLTIDATPGVAVSNINVVNSTTATATFAIAGDAESGDHEVRVTTPYGVSQAVPFSVRPLPPSISAITPGSGVVGTAVNVALSGTNFTSTLAVEALPGITVSNFTVVDAVSASATFTIESAAAAGGRDVRVRTAWGTSDAATFSVLPLAPTLTGVNPASAILNTLVGVTLTGTNFLPGMTVEAGADITVSNVDVVNSTTATATLAIGPAAGLGERAITVTTAGGSSAAVPLTILPPPPQLTGIDPATIVQGTRTSTYFFTLTGTNFFSPKASVSGADVAIGGIEARSATSAALMLIVSPNAATGTREIRVTTSGGTSEPALLTLLPPIPTLTGMTPSIMAKGHSVRVMLTGTNFVGGANPDSIPGITIGDVTMVDETTLYAVFSIASDATSGVRHVTVTTPRGTSSSLAFTVVDPFPDLSVAVSAGKFGIGFNGTYELAVSNVGTLATSGEILVNAALPVDLSFMYAAGTGWTCSAAGPAVTCRNAGRLAPGASSTLTLTVAVESKAAATGNHTVSVSTTGDLNAANNSATNVTTVSPSPFPQLVFSPRTLTPGQQATVAVRLDAPFPHDVTGTLTLGFTPNAIALLDDPAIQFATGGRAVRFTVHANDLQATFEGAASPGPIGFQAGTLAGTLIFRGRYAVGNIQDSFPSLGFDTLRIAPQVPTIHEIRTSTDRGFAASVVVSSTSREMTQLSLTFNTDQSVRLSCGTTAGCTLSDKTLTFDVSALFSEWFATDRMLGSLTLLQLPLNIEGGTVAGSVAVTLSNSYGASNSMSFNLP